MIAQEVELYHIELESHDILVANGAPAESYRDDGNRWLFRNVNEAWDLRPRPSCAPLLMGGPLVDAVWRRLFDRIGLPSRVPLTSDSDLHLMVDGERVDPVSRNQDQAIFRLRRPKREVRIVSRDAIPAELGIAQDFRSLGVSISGILLVQQQRKITTVSMDDPRLADGFHPFEPEAGVRWTDGNAGLPLGLFTEVSGQRELLLQLGPTTRYVDGPAFARAA